MQFTQITAALITLAVAAAASPAGSNPPAKPDVVAVRDSITLFQDINFGGTFFRSQNPQGCQPVPVNLENDVSSMIIEQNLNCSTYKLINCVSSSLMGVFGGGNYPNLEPNNDLMQSYLCNLL